MFSSQKPLQSQPAAPEQKASLADLRTFIQGSMSPTDAEIARCKPVIQNMLNEDVQGALTLLEDPEYPDMAENSYVFNLEGFSERVGKDAFSKLYCGNTQAIQNKIVSLHDLERVFKSFPPDSPQGGDQLARGLLMHDVLTQQAFFSRMMNTVENNVQASLAVAQQKFPGYADSFFSTCAQFFPSSMPPRPPR